MKYIIAVLLTLVLALGGVFLVPAAQEVMVCHATGSAGNPYVRVNVSLHSVDDASGLNGHGIHGDDIWAAFEYLGVEYPGQGDASGLDSNCNVIPDATSTPLPPTPTITPDPTPTDLPPTETPNPTDTPTDEPPAETPTDSPPTETPTDQPPTPTSTATPPPCPDGVIIITDEGYLCLPPPYTPTDPPPTATPTATNPPPPETGLDRFSTTSEELLNLEWMTTSLEVSIPSVGIEAPVAVGSYDGDWVMSASYYDGTFWPEFNLLGLHSPAYDALYGVEVGDTIDFNGVTYEVYDTLLIGFDDTWVLNQADLTLITCYGPNWNQRFVVYAEAPFLDTLLQ